jgi:hypothetical protein
LTQPSHEQIAVALTSYFCRAVHRTASHFTTGCRPNASCQNNTSVPPEAGRLSAQSARIASIRLPRCTDCQSETAVDRGSLCVGCYEVVVTIVYRVPARTRAAVTTRLLRDAVAA